MWLLHQLQMRTYNNKSYSTDIYLKAAPTIKEGIFIIISEEYEEEYKEVLCKCEVWLDYYIFRALIIVVYQILK